MSSETESLTSTEDRAVMVRWLSDTSRPLLGWGCIGFGLLALLLGWVGVSGEVLVAKQLPYLASGGLVGVSLVVLGGRILLIDDLRRDADRVDRLERMVEDLHAVLLMRTGEPDAAANGSSNGRRKTTTGLVALRDGTSFHRPDCPMLEGKDDVTGVKPKDVTQRGLVACPLCDPVAVSR